MPILGSGEKGRGDLRREIDCRQKCRFLQWLQWVGARLATARSLACSLPSRKHGARRVQRSSPLSLLQKQGDELVWRYNYTDWGQVYAFTNFCLGCTCNFVDSWVRRLQHVWHVVFARGVLRPHAPVYLRPLELGKLLGGEEVSEGRHAGWSLVLHSGD